MTKTFPFPELTKVFPIAEEEMLGGVVVYAKANAGYLYCDAAMSDSVADGANKMPKEQIMHLFQLGLLTVKFNNQLFRPVMCKETGAYATLTVIGTSGSTATAYAFNTKEYSAS